VKINPPHLGGYPQPRTQTRGYEAASAGHHNTKSHAKLVTPVCVNTTGAHPKEPFQADVLAVAKDLFMFVRLKHHLRNWELLPQNLDNKIQQFIKDLHPPLPNPNLQQQYVESGKTFADCITQITRHHMLSLLDQCTNTLKSNTIIDEAMSKAASLASSWIRNWAGSRPSNTLFSDLAVAQKSTGLNQHTFIIAHQPPLDPLTAPQHTILLLAPLHIHFAHPTSLAISPLLVGNSHSQFRKRYRSPASPMETPSKRNAPSPNIVPHSPLNLPNVHW